jgi:hypothetical protein
MFTKGDNTMQIKAPPREIMVPNKDIAVGRKRAQRRIADTEGEGP